ncbi:ATP-binding cassette domain-containing protein [Microbacterium sp.]|uniref:ATP-binding cassette domain-containing protein n=1 Tax=Microbacterium sp. TaxID=51671 RepID=UPI0028110248|nr:ATP-binding cassette domain-containing protein [Microbacterium sp.]
MTASLDSADDPVDATTDEKKAAAPRSTTTRKTPAKPRATKSASTDSTTKSASAKSATTKSATARTSTAKRTAKPAVDADASKAAAAKKAAASTTATKAAATKRASTTSAARTAAVKAAATRTAAEKASSKSAAAKSTAAKTAAAKTAAAKAAAEKKAAAERAAAEKVAAEQAAAEKATENAVASQDAAEQPAPAPKARKKASAPRPTASKPRTVKKGAAADASAADTDAPLRAAPDASDAPTPATKKKSAPRASAKKTTAPRTATAANLAPAETEEPRRPRVAASNSAPEAAEARPPRTAAVALPVVVTTPDESVDDAARVAPETTPEPAADAPTLPGLEAPDASATASDPAVDTPAVDSPAADTSAASPLDTPSATTRDDAVRIRGLVKRFGDTRAVDGVDLTVPAGSFYGLVGPNGAGKTTTLSIIAGLLRPDAGTVHISGIDQRAKPLAAKKMMGVLPDRLRTFDRLTGRQLLYYYGQLRGLDRAVIEKRAADLARAFDLTEALSRVVSDYSAGMTKKLMLAGAMIHSPRVLVLDEPFEAVDPVSSGVILDILRSYVAHGGTVILSSHGMDLVERVCSRVAVIVGGEVLAEGTIDEVRAGQTLEARFVELSGSSGEVEGLEWLHTFSD